MVEPVVIGDATLYCGDCRDILPTLGKVDAVVTDPPYGIEEIVGGYGRAGRTIENDTTLDVCNAGVLLAMEQMENGYCAAFFSCRVTREFHAGLAELDYFGEIIWDKKAPGMGNPLRYQHENIAIFQKGEPHKLGETFSIIKDFRCGAEHPHQKPQIIMSRLCQIVGGNTVLDPFMGSGSTGVAAVNLGKKFIGVELDKKYFDIACKRIEESQRQSDLFIQPTKAKPEKPADLFADSENPA